MDFKLFNVSNGYLSPKDKRFAWYNIPIDELPMIEYGRSRWFTHMPEKNWFTEDYFWDMLSAAKHFHPDVDFSRHIFEAAKVFQYKHIARNPDNYVVLSKIYEKIPSNGQAIY